MTVAPHIANGRVAPQPAAARGARNGIGSAPAVDFGPLANLAGFMLRLAQIRLFESFFRDFGPREVTPGQIGILVAVGRTPGVRQGVLAEALSIKRSNMAKIVGLLGRKGLLKRRVPTSDRRAIELSLTRAGQALVDGIVPELMVSDRAATAMLSDRDLAHLLRLIGRLAGGVPAEASP